MVSAGTALIQSRQPSARVSVEGVRSESTRMVGHYFGIENSNLLFQRHNVDASVIRLTAVQHFDSLLAVGATWH